MDSVSYKTVSLNQATVKKDWFVVDAENEVLGRLASKVAKILRGKHKPGYTPHVDCGDNVIIVNAEKVRLTGNKFTDQGHYTYTGYPGGQKFVTAAKLMTHRPGAIIERAVKGMLPKTKLGRAICKNLHVYTGPEHKHQAQQPQPLNLNTIK